MNRHGWLLLTLLPATLALQGCLGAAAVVQAVPAVMGVVAVGGADDRSPFAIQMPPPAGQAAATGDEDLAVLSTKMRSAECGEPWAQYWLATRLDNGFNATPDYVEVYKWYRLAEKGGVTQASERIDALDATLPQDQVEQARALSRSWKPATENCPQQG